MLSLFDSFTRPSAFYPNFSFLSPNEPRFYENEDSYIMKLYLEDVIDDGFSYSLSDDKVLSINWKDTKQIKHHGRVYTSIEDNQKTLQLPEYVKEDDIDVKLKDDYCIVTIKKQKDESTTNDNTKAIINTDNNMLMKLNLPQGDNDDVSISIDNNKLTVNVKSSTEKKSDDNKSLYKCSKQITRSMTIPEGINIDDIDSKIIDGQLKISLLKSLHKLEKNKLIEETKDEEPPKKKQKI